MGKRQAKRTSLESHGAASKFGQLIGDAFADHVFQTIQMALADRHPNYVLLESGDALSRLKMAGGTVRQIDGVITQRGFEEPIAIVESKWLKDARHHNDKGAWILQLREIARNIPRCAEQRQFWQAIGQRVLPSCSALKAVCIAH